MSEAPGLPEQAPDEFTLMRRYWEEVLNDPALAPHQLIALKGKALDILDDVAGTYGQEVMFWGRAVRVQVASEQGGVVASPIFMDNQYWGRSIATNIANIPSEIGGSDTYKVYHQINYFNKVQTGYEVISMLFDYDRGNFKFIDPIVPIIESGFVRHSPLSSVGAKRQGGELVTYANSIVNYVASGALETASPYARLRFLDKKANAAARIGGILHQDILLKADRAYSLDYVEGSLKFKPIDISNIVLPANCMAITSFEAIENGWPGKVGLPIDEGLCMALDVHMPLEEVATTQALYVPLGQNALEYDLQVNVSARKEANHESSLE